MKNIFFVLCTILCLSSCGEKKENTAPASEVQSNETSVSTIPSSFPNTVFNYQKDNLSGPCTHGNEFVCLIENTIKCALNNTQSFCDKKSMPDFIFYDDAMFADDNGLGRPTEQSFQIIKMKTIDDSTIEIFTKGTCDKNWFGICEGNIIYVLTNKNDKWRVKEVYSLEKI